MDRNLIQDHNDVDFRQRTKALFQSPHHFHDDLVYLIQEENGGRNKVRLSVTRLNNVSRMMDKGGIDWEQTYFLNIISQLKCCFEIFLLDADFKETQVMSREIFALPSYLERRNQSDGSPLNKITYPQITFQLHDSSKAIQIARSQKIQVKLVTSSGITFINETISFDHLFQEYCKEHRRLKNIEHEIDDIEDVWLVLAGDKRLKLRVRPFFGSGVARFGFRHAVLSLLNRGFMHAPEQMFIFPEAIKIHKDTVISSLQPPPPP